MVKWSVFCVLQIIIFWRLRKYCNQKKEPEVISENISVIILNGFAQDHFPIRRDFIFLATMNLWKVEKDSLIVHKKLYLAPKAPKGEADLFTNYESQSTERPMEVEFVDTLEFSANSNTFVLPRRCAEKWLHHIVEDKKSDGKSDLVAQ